MAALKRRAVAVSVLLALVASPAFADGDGHGHGPPTVAADPNLLWWGVLSLTGLFAVLVGARRVLLGSAAPAAERVGYLTAVRSFSRNARLFLGYSLLADLGSGIWGVLFNLYLLRAGYDIGFIGLFWLLNMLCHGAAALPAGVIADRFGRRRAFFIATGVSIAAQGSLLLVNEPLLILALAAVAGFGEAFHGVTGAPFMMENSEPRERPHLFSLNAAFLQVSRFGGSITGGLLPLVWAGLVGLPEVDPAAARLALITGLPLTAVALVPLAFMREKRPTDRPASLADLVLLRNVVSLHTILQFTVLSLMVGVGFGLTIRFFNVFFQQAHGATDAEVGTILGLGAIAGASSILIAPTVAQHWGKARGIFLSQIASVPFLLGLAFVPGLSVVLAFYLTRNALYSVAQPLRNQLAMEFVEGRERGTTAGFTHTAFDLGGGLGAGMAGLLITGNGFALNFLAAALLVAVPAYLYDRFFARRERAVAASAGAALVSPSGQAAPAHVVAGSR